MLMLVIILIQYFFRVVARQISTHSTYSKFITHACVIKNSLETSLLNYIITVQSFAILRRNLHRTFNYICYITSYGYFYTNNRGSSRKV